MKWTPAEDAALKEHYPTDLALDLVVQRVCEASGNDRARNSVIGRANRLGLQRDGEMNRELWLMRKSGMSQGEIAKATGLTRSAANAGKKNRLQRMPGTWRSVKRSTLAKPP